MMPTQTTKYEGLACRFILAAMRNHFQYTLFANLVETFNLSQARTVAPVSSPYWPPVYRRLHFKPLPVIVSSPAEAEPFPKPL